MSWQYIAGFFDGEGSVSCVGEQTPHVALDQAGNTGVMVLGRIAEFLIANGIPCKVTEFNPTITEKVIGRLQKYRIRLTNRDVTTKFLTGVLPYLHVKKVIAQDTLRHFRLYPVGTIGKMRRQEGVRLRMRRYAEQRMKAN